MKLTNQQIQKMSEAIAALDGSQVLQVIDGKAVGIARNYRIGHAARWALARIQGRLHAVVADFERAQQGIFRECAAGRDALEPRSAEHNRFVAAINALLRETVELELPSIALTDLKLAENETAGNELPIQVLAALGPLIKLETQNSQP